MKEKLINVPLRFSCVRIHKSAFRFHVYYRWLSFIDYMALSVVLNRKHCVIIVLGRFLWGGPDQNHSDHGASSVEPMNW